MIARRYPRLRFVVQGARNTYRRDPVTFEPLVRLGKAVFLAGAVIGIVVYEGVTQLARLLGGLL